MSAPGGVAGAAEPAAARRTGRGPRAAGPAGRRTVRRRVAAGRGPERAVGIVPARVPPGAVIIVAVVDDVAAVVPHDVAVRVPLRVVAHVHARRAAAAEQGG